jgi:hypothetical protein
MRWGGVDADGAELPPGAMSEGVDGTGVMAGEADGVELMMVPL